MHKGRYISALLMFVLMLNLFAVPCMADGGETPLKLLFDLDISSYDGTAASLADSTGNTTNFEIQDNPTPGTIINTTGTKKYIKFAERNGTTNKNEKAAIKATNPAVLNKDELTIEAWAYVDDANVSGNYQRIFSLNNGAGSEAVCELEITSGSPNIFKYKMASDATASFRVTGSDNGTYYKKRWVHYVFTRKWVENDTKVEYHCYVDGNDINATTLAGSRINETGKTLCIGGDGLTGARTGLLGNIAEFRIYDGILTAEQISEKYNNEKGDFVELAKTMALESITPEANSVIDSYSNEITLNFDNYIDASTLNNISLIGEDGSAPKGGIDVYMPEEVSKTLKIKYGKLTPGQTYTLTINGLTSLNNIPFNSGSYTAEFTSLSYTVVDGKDYLIYEDFSGAEYVVDAKAPTATALKMISGDVADDSSLIMVRSTESGDKYLELTASEVNKATSVKLDFAPISEGTTIIEMKMQPASTRTGSTGTALREMCKVTADTGRVVTLAKPENDTNVIKGYIAQTPTNYYYQSTATDDNGFHHMRFIITKDGDTLKYRAEDVNAPGWTWAKEDTCYGEGETSFNSLELANMTAAAEDQLQDKIWISSISIRRVIAPEVLATSLNEMTDNDNILEITFDDDMDKSTFYDDSIVIKNMKTNKLLRSAVKGYDADTRTVSVELLEYFDSGDPYSISFSDITNEGELSIDAEYSYDFTAKEYPLTVDATDTAQNKLTISNSSASKKTGKIFFMKKDTDGRISSVNATAFEVEKNSSKPVTFMGDGSGEVFIWDTTDGMNIPVLPNLLTK